MHSCFLKAWVHRNFKKKKMLRRNIYKWHRTISLLIAIPVLLWALSGFMHPIMTTFRPKVGSQFLTPKTLDTSKIKMPLQEVLNQNKIAEIANFRIVQMAGNYFYQIKLPNNKVLQYYSTQNGKALKNGDVLYARFIAKYYLLGKNKNNYSALSKSTKVFSQSENEESAIYDCCSNTSLAIMKDTVGAEVVDVDFIENFDNDYKSINRLLPVYKVSFNRSDGIVIYVETAQDRFAFALDNKRIVFDRIFAWFHTWSWLDFLGKGKLVFEAILCFLAIASTLMGLYIFFTTSRKKNKDNSIKNARTNHRWTSLVFSVFTLMFTASGAFHALEKLKPDDRDSFFKEDVFNSSKIAMDFSKLSQSLGGSNITNIGIVKMNGDIFWQVFYKKPLNNYDNIALATPMGDTKKNKIVTTPSIIYFHSTTFQPLINGERKYAAYLASQFSKNAEKDTSSLEFITKFEGEYGFVNKRLPVWKVNFPFNGNQRWYIETSTGKLAAKINDYDLVEGFSFAFLHKHHFMDFAGKSWRDFSTMFAAMSQIILVVIGLVLWRKSFRKKNRL
jgi:hypothetical protein